MVDPAVRVGDGLDGSLTPPAAADLESAAPAGFQPLQAIVSLGAIQVLAMLAGIARVKVLAVLLGPSGVGIAGVIDTVVSLVVQVGSLSIPFAALKFISRAHPRPGSDVSRLHLAFTKALTISTCLAAGVAMTIAHVRPGLLGDGLSAHEPAVMAAIAGVPAIALGTMLKNVLAALGGHRESALVGLVAAVSLVAASYAGVRTAGLPGLFVGNLAVAVFTIVITQLYLGRRFKLPAFSLRVRALDAFKAEREFFRFAGSMYVLAMTSPLTYLVSRSFVLDRDGAAAAGFLFAGYNVGLSVRTVLNQANGLYLTPLVNRASPVVQRARASAEYMRILLVLFVLAALPLALFPQQVVAVLYQAKFAPAASLIGVFILAEGALLIAGVYQTLLIGLDDTFGFLGCTVSGHLTTLALTAPLAARWGPLGVGLSFVCGNGIILVASTVLLVTRHRLRETLAPMFVVGLGVLSIALCAAGVVAFPHVWYVLRLAVYLTVGAGMIGVLTAEERRWLLNPLRAMFHRARR
jgi:O-antigen/teichoic acid export membrane protein